MSTRTMLQYFPWKQYRGTSRGLAKPSATGLRRGAVEVCVGTKSLSTCSMSTDFTLVTCFDLTLDGVPVRRGVICRVSDTETMAWFLSKSSSADHLFTLRSDFSESDSVRLVAQPITKMNDFTKRVPPLVRARCCGPSNGRPRASYLPRKPRQASAVGGPGDDLIHPNLNPVPTTTLPPSSKRIAKASPGCSPPDSPRAKRAAPGLQVHKKIDDLLGVVGRMEKSLSKMRKQVKKMRRVVKKQSNAGRTALVHHGDSSNTVGTEVTEVNHVDWS